MPDWSLMEERNRKMAPIRAVYGPVKKQAVQIFENWINYPIEEVVKLVKLSREIEGTPFGDKTYELVQQMRDELAEVKPDGNHPKIVLWKEGNMPAETAYTDNSDYRYNHDPDFHPYMYEHLISEDVKPKGAIVVCAGGDHAEACVTESWNVIQDFNALGYQVFHLMNRTNHNPWTAAEAGVDAARAIQYIRAHADEYRIESDQIAFAGFSNGGVTGEGLIQYFSGTRSIKDHFPAYIPDELDQYSPVMNAFLCVYGPRHEGDPFDYTDVNYPPTFFAVGREDMALINLNAVYPDLIAHHVPVEVHTFAGTPHGQAGAKLMDGYVRYPNFELWKPLADYFLQDLFRK